MLYLVIVGNVSPSPWFDLLALVLGMSIFSYVKLRAFFMILANFAAALAANYFQVILLIKHG